MNPVAQLIVVRYNGQTNAYGGPRNEFTLVSVTDKDKIKETIADSFKTALGTHLGCVLVKYDGRMWLCERDRENQQRVHVKHEIEYHPHAKHFTI